MTSILNWLTHKVLLCSERLVHHGSVLGRTTIKLTYHTRLICNFTYLLSTPPRSEAFKHSGGDSLLWTSPTVTLYLLVLDNKLSLPGTEQNTSLGAPMPRPPPMSLPFMSERLVDLLSVVLLMPKVHVFVLLTSQSLYALIVTIQMRFE
jgi:hypothetical protein